MAKRWSLDSPFRMPGMGNPDEMTVNAPGDTTFTYGGGASGVDNLVGGFGGLLQMAGVENPPYSSDTSGIDYGSGYSDETGTYGDNTGYGYSDETGTYDAGGVQESFPDNSRNPLNQPVNNVSSLSNPNDYNQVNYMDKTKQYEGGARDSVYVDSEGNPTSGVGHKLTQDELGKHGLAGQSFEPNQEFTDLKVSQDDISSQYESDYGKAQTGAGNIFGENFGDAPEEVQGIMSDMVFNLGESGVKNKFPSMVKAMQSGDYAQAAAHLRYKDPTQDESGAWVGGEGGESNWWNQTGAGDKRYTSGVWDTTGSRGWDHYNTLMNMPQNTVNDVVDSDARVNSAFTQSE